MSEVGRSSGSGAGLALDIDLRKVGRLVGPYCPVSVGHLTGITDSDWSVVTILRAAHPDG